MLGPCSPASERLLTQWCANPGGFGADQEAACAAAEGQGEAEAREGCGSRSQGGCGGRGGTQESSVETEDWRSEGLAGK